MTSAPIFTQDDRRGVLEMETLIDERFVDESTGVLKLAYKPLVNDKAKFSALLVGITFAVCSQLSANRTHSIPASRG
jgi:hypothetical protein